MTMEADLFYPLTQRSIMLLLTTLSIGGTKDLSLLAFLPQRERDILVEKANQLQQLESRQRLLIMNQEMKRHFLFRGLVGIESIEPSWIIPILEKENPKIVAVILNNLSSSYKKKVLQKLSLKLRGEIKLFEDQSMVSVEMARSIRQIFESQFAQMPLNRKLLSFRFDDITVLSTQELIHLIRALGVEELAAAFASIGQRALMDFCMRLDEKNRQELVEAYRQLNNAENLIDSHLAKTFLAKILTNFNNSDELFQKAGMYRLAKSLLYSESLLVSQVAQRFPQVHGNILLGYVDSLKKKIDQFPLKECYMIQNRILHKIKKLAEIGKVDSQLLNLTFTLNQLDISE